MDEVLHDMALFRRFAKLDLTCDNMPDESTILRFRRRLERHGLGEQMLKTVNALLSARGLLFKAGTLVDADSGGSLHQAPGSGTSASGSPRLSERSARKRTFLFGLATPALMPFHANM